MYIHIHTLLPDFARIWYSSERRAINEWPEFIGWSDNHFNNLCFKQTQTHQRVFSCTCSHVVISFVSSEIMRCRLLK